MTHRWILCLIAGIALVAMPRDAKAGSCCGSHSRAAASTSEDARATSDLPSVAAESQIQNERDCMPGCAGCLCGCNPNPYRSVPTPAVLVDTELVPPGCFAHAIAIVEPDHPVLVPTPFARRNPAHHRVKRRESLLRHDTVLPMRD